MHSVNKIVAVSIEEIDSIVVLAILFVDRVLDSVGLTFMRVYGGIGEGMIFLRREVKSF